MYFSVFSVVMRNNSVMGFGRIVEEWDVYCICCWLHRHWWELLRRMTALLNCLIAWTHSEK